MFGRGRAAGVIGILATAAGFSSSVAQDRLTRIEVMDHATTAVVTDVGPTGDSPGDIRTSHDRLFTSGKLAGRTQGECVRVLPRKGSWECGWTVKVLGKGSLTVEGPLFDGSNSALAVTGGTGAFLAARGQLLLRQKSDTRWLLRFELLTNR
jgi:allene oxide cyclase